MNYFKKFSQPVFILTELAVVMIVFIIGILHYHQPTTLSLTDNETGQTFTVRVGDTINLDLNKVYNSYPQLGYDRTILKLTPAPEAFGDQIYGSNYHQSFTVKAAGTTDITVDLMPACAQTGIMRCALAMAPYTYHIIAK